MDLFLLSKVLPALVLPPGGLVLALVAGLVLRRRYPRMAAALVVLATAVLYAMSTGVVSGPLLRDLEAHQALRYQDPRLAGLQAIVILGGGRQSWAPEYHGDTVSAATLQRIRYGAVLHRQTRLPVAVTGGAVFGRGRPEGKLMAEVLHREMNVQVRWVEARSRNTEENARLLRPLLEAHGVARIALVTHASHMTRASEMFRDQGFQVVAAPMGFSVGPPLPSEWWDWLPSASSFMRSYVAIHELVGRLWYRLRRD